MPKHSAAEEPCREKSILKACHALKFLDNAQSSVIVRRVRQGAQRGHRPVFRHPAIQKPEGILCSQVQHPFRPTLNKGQRNSENLCMCKSL
jgi:hypothetical protein